MSLFQHSVLNKYLKEASQDEMKAAYEKLKEYFHNPVIQQNIRESKEEQFQEGFLRELFVKVLGYTINPNPDYNLTTEFKNERGAKKADGAILKEGAAIGVIELKSTKTKDLESIRLQAFDYKANQQKCVYVITSNFEKVRFYINNAVDFEEFDLFRLEYPHFQLMWLCLVNNNLLNGIPLAIKEASVLKEENVTKKIYVDYSLFKHELYHNLIHNNLGNEIFKGLDEKEIKLTLFKKSQKLLDRFLFIFFGEDRGLLPPNSISKIIQKWNEDLDWGENKTLYSIYKQYFNFLNIGRKASGKRSEIFAYNGGLFAPDEVLDNIVISDEVLKKHTEILTGYDFETEVDVNILGHIFENSLNEIEEKTAQIEGAEVDLKKSKRKKDGVFYTPKYITKYIVENTVGKLCDEKKTELQIEESEYLKSRKGRTTKKLKELDHKLDTYREWLLTLTICDPACGSGAFLNQALDFLIREHRYIDELKAKLLDVPIIFTEVENSILEKNIYGVDINEESVEIAKLSLWLRTAQKGRKLTTLSNNIKCGNSLIDDPEVAGEKAFNWQNEFPEIFIKKKKEAWHITTATHNSRYSQRMFDNHVPSGKAIWLSEKEEKIIAEEILRIKEKYNLNILALNVCGDHMHLLMVCEEDEIPGNVQKIKSITARSCNIAMGRTTTREHAPLHAPSQAQDTQDTPEQAPVYKNASAPSLRQEAQELAPVHRNASAPSLQEEAQETEETPEQFPLQAQETQETPDTPDTPEQAPVYKNASTPSLRQEAQELAPVHRNASAPSLREHAPASEHGKTQAHLWAQKYGCKKITSDSQLQNTIDYIATNRHKHNLPVHKELEKLIAQIVCTPRQAYQPEYKGGFDVVIGNPPYVRNEFISEQDKKFFANKYSVFTGKSDLYVYFFEHVYNILKNKGKCGFIVSSKFTKTKYGKVLIDFLNKKTHIKSFIDFKDLDVFSGIVAYPSTIVYEKLEVIHSENVESYLLVVNNENYWEINNLFSGAITVKQGELFNRLGSWSSGVTDEGLFNLLKKLKSNFIPLSNIVSKPQVGIKTGSNTSYLFSNKKVPAELNYSKLISDYIVGREVKRYKPIGPSNKLLLPYTLVNNKMELIKDIESYEPELKFLLTNKNKLSKRAIIDKGLLNGTKLWYEFQQIKTDFPYYSKYIIYPDISSTVNFTFAENIYYDMTCFGLPSNSNSLLGILNSKLIKIFLNMVCVKARGGYLRLKSQYILNIPLPENYENKQLSNIVEQILSLEVEFSKIERKFINFFTSKIFITLSHKLQNWHELDFNSFITELNKAIKKAGGQKLSKMDEMEWMEVFESKKAEAQKLKAEIEKTDREIDQLVYALYGLTEEEIRIVEESA